LGNLSIIAPLANVVLLPMVPFAMLFGALALVGGLLWLPLGQRLATVAYLFLAWLTEGARLFAELPYAAVQLPPFPLWALLAYYAIVVGGWLWNLHLASGDTGARRPARRPRRHRGAQSRHDPLEALWEDRRHPRHAGLRRVAGAGDRGGEEVAGVVREEQDAHAHQESMGIHIHTSRSPQLPFLLMASPGLLSAKWGEFRWTDSCY
jgi:Competence protein